MQLYGVRYFYPAYMQHSIPMKFLETKGNRKSVELHLFETSPINVRNSSNVLLSISLKIFFSIFIRNIYLYMCMENSEIRILNPSYVLIEEESVA